jgi:hypothetical protein
MVLSGFSSADKRRLHWDARRGGMQERAKRWKSRERVLTTFAFQNTAIPQRKSMVQCAVKEGTFPSAFKTYFWFSGLRDL